MIALMVVAAVGFAGLMVFIAHDVQRRGQAWDQLPLDDGERR